MILCGGCLSPSFYIRGAEQNPRETYNKPYDLNLLDWFQALFGKDRDPQKTGRFWCSAFIGFIFTCAGIIDENTDWSIMRPCDFAVDGGKLDYASQDCMLLPWEKVLKKDWKKFN